ncbi:uncharacterized protein LOC123201985 isoform X2 [Mangifera indica]|uniref:uncharacterized protein LOC123201985 isoform X2 n=1 Tax=Mangifera indica TaxID=29780 RepID=UPI001CFA0C40|nr:uncharacterized protein LOC123201985 isoform X2 [Mangifera indica]
MEEKSRLLYTSDRSLFWIPLSRLCCLRTFCLPLLVWTTVVTTRRILERLGVQYVSERTVWKLLKDAPKSAMQKAERGLPTFVYFVRVSQTTFRGHFLGVAATWIVQVGLEVYLSVSCIMKSGEESNKFKSQEAKLLGKRFLVLPSGVTWFLSSYCFHRSRDRCDHHSPFSRSVDRLCCR